MELETLSPRQRRRLSVVRLAEPSGSETFAEAVAKGLGSLPKTLPCRYFYDQEGSELFEAICSLPEYYLTRAEDAILRDFADEMVGGWFQSPAFLELGSGSSTKTRRLIEAGLSAYGTLDYLPIDVSPTILEESARELVRDYEGLRVSGYAADYRRALARLALEVDCSKLVIFLGSSLGNYETEAAVELLSAIGESLSPGDRLLLGTDLVKDRATLEAAYSDSQGVTARFNQNLLTRINRELGGDFVVEKFAHEARFRADLCRVEMHLVSLEEQVVRVAGAGIVARFGRGESIHTESSHKYTPELLADLAMRSGFAEEMAWTDSDGLFRVQRWRLNREED